VALLYARSVAMSEYVRSLRAKVGHDLLFWPAVACLLRDAADQVLLVRHVEGRWTFPAGAMDPGETPAEAARRETREEASVDVELVRIAGVFGGYPYLRITYPNGDEATWVTILFEGRILAGTPAPGDDETAEVRWVSLDEVLELEISRSTRHMLECVRDGRMFDA
jgi:8-oxo-dGTP pyrophosphatase MutT (NUDIX family)